jgi:hypothetical protein
VPPRPELRRVRAGSSAVHDRVGPAQDAQERASTTPIVGRAADEPGDLDELHEHATDPGQGRHRAQRRERVVAGLDLDIGQGLEDGRLADVGRPHQRDLGSPFAPHGDRVAVHGARADAGVLDLGQQGLAEVRVGTVLVVGQLGEQGPHLADALPTLLPDEPSLRDLGERAMRHGHDDHLLRTRSTSPTRGAPSTDGDEQHASPARPFHRRGCWKGRISR